MTAVVVCAFVPGLAAAVLLFGAGSASAWTIGDTVTITGTYTSEVNTTSSDPAFAPCTALPQPSEPFWAFVDGHQAISGDVPGLCSYTSSPDPGQPGVTDYLLTYSYGASWGIEVWTTYPVGTMTLTMSFHTIDNIVATATYLITAPTTSSTIDATTTSATTDTSAATTTDASTSATTETTPPPTTVTAPSPEPPATTTEATAPPSTSTTAAGPVVPHARYLITTPATTHARRSGNTVTIAIATNSTRRMLLCYRIRATASATCRAGHGAWNVQFAAAKPGVIRRLFLIKINATVVATKTITIRIA
jgi:hypothetical protein